MQTIIEPEEFADRLYTLRGRLSRKVLAKKVGVSRSTIANWEDGITEPKAGDIIRLLRALELKAKDLFEK